MRQSETTVADTNGYRRSETFKDSAKRKRLDDSLPGEEMQLDDNDHQDDERIAPEAVQNGILEEDDELIVSHSEQKLESQAMEVSTQHIRQKMDLFTQKVSGLLDAGKTFFVDVATAFEERIVQLHQKQMEKWEQEIELLRTMDAINEDMSFRLADARATISLVRSGPAIPAPS